MELALVVGQCTATVKDAALEGRKLALVRRANSEGTAIGEVEVALDVTGSGAGQLVVVVRGSGARQPADTRQLPTDLAIVAVVDEVTTSAVAPKSAPRTAKQAHPQQAKKAPPTSAASRTQMRGK